MKRKKAPCGCGFREETILRKSRYLFPTVFVDCFCSKCNKNWTERYEFDFSVPVDGRTYQDQDYFKKGTCWFPRPISHEKS